MMTEHHPQLFNKYNPFDISENSFALRNNFMVFQAVTKKLFASVRNLKSVENYVNLEGDIKNLLKRNQVRPNKTKIRNL